MKYIFMTIKQRRKALSEKLIKAGRDKPDNFTSRCQAIAIKLGISSVTVRNYLRGNVGCGYTGEAVLAEWLR